jgi:hypothetical protein
VWVTAAPQLSSQQLLSNWFYSYFIFILFFLLSLPISLHTEYVIFAVSLLVGLNMT